MIARIELDVQRVRVIRIFEDLIRKTVAVDVQHIDQRACKRFDLVFYFAGALDRARDGTWSATQDALGFIENGKHEFQLEDGNINYAYWNSGYSIEERERGIEKLRAKMKPKRFAREDNAETRSEGAKGAEIESRFQAWLVAQGALDPRTSASARTCVKCGLANDADALFCNKCGNAIGSVCVCGATNRPGAEFCKTCGKSLAL